MSDRKQAFTATLKFRLLGTTCLKAVAEVRVVTDSVSASKVDGDIFMVLKSCYCS